MAYCQIYNKPVAGKHYERLSVTHYRADITLVDITELCHQVSTGIKLRLIIGE
jgi:hypothetical protein